MHVTDMMWSCAAKGTLRSVVLLCPHPCPQNDYKYRDVDALHGCPLGCHPLFMLTPSVMNLIITFTM